MMTDKDNDYINTLAKITCSIRPHVSTEFNIEDALKAYTAVTVPRGQRMITRAYQVALEAIRHKSSKENPFIVGIWGLTKEIASKDKKALEEIFKKWGVAEIIKLEVVEMKKKKPQKIKTLFEDYWKPKKKNNTKCILKR